ncbi:hypothetical protein PSm6_52480 [Pseudomonas solani]|uniref:Inner membrane protein n=1 Tax=Pseudomonas solani TaxID=2731552 RepID=A0ABM7LGX6_9PSED|nr:hypothetical protein L682_06470 [Pseudomonas alcaligenes OT 69]BCD88841.1 hypothetical protein PSm6_52480 [Pseudomonas solani]
MPTPPPESLAGDLPVAAPAPSRSRISRLLFALLAYTSLGVGMVGLVLPGLPTTEFVLLAAWAASKSSPRLANWLDNHRLFGPILKNWRNGRAIARRAKLAASASMLLALVIMLISLPHGAWLYLVMAGMLLGNLWIWSRPDRR